MKTKPARIDADGTAIPKTKIVKRMIIGRCQHYGIRAADGTLHAHAHINEDIELRSVSGESIKLK